MNKLKLYLPKYRELES